MHRFKDSMKSLNASLRQQVEYENGGLYEKAELEFENFRNENLWYKCQAETNYNNRMARALYIKTAVSIIKKKEDESYITQEITRRAEEEDDELYQINMDEIARLESLIRKNNKKSPFTRASIGFICGALLSFFFFGKIYVTGADGFFSSAWRWLASGIHLVTFSFFVGCSFSIYRYKFINHEEHDEIENIRDEMEEGESVLTSKFKRNVILFFIMGVISILLWFLL